ncbi:MAG: tetratricopeptide repeat protein [Myxococcota bacterium]
MSRIKTRNWAWTLVAALFIGATVMAAGCAGAQQKKDEQQKTKDAEWHYEMGAGYFESQEIPLAIRELHKAIEMKPDLYKAHHLLGFIYMGRREYAKSIQHFKETLRLKPEYHFAKNNLGTVYLAMERWREAAEIFEELLDQPLYTTPELAHNNLGWAYYNLREYRQALQHYKKATFLKPQMCLAYNNMGRVHEAMGNTLQARSQYQKAIRKCPNNYAEPHFNLGKLLQKQGSSEARAHFQRCHQIEPESNLGERCRQYLQVR